MDKFNRFLLWVVRVVICLLWADLIAALVAQKVTIPWTPDSPGVGGVLLRALPLILIFWAVVIIAVRKTGRRGEAFLWPILFIAAPLVLSIPYPEQEIQYSRADLAVPLEVPASYETMLRYSNNGTNEWTKVNLDSDLMQLAGSWTNLAEYAEEIETAWNEFEAGRAYVAELDAFPGLTDLVDDVPISAETPTVSLKFFREAAQIYSLNAMQQAQSANVDEGLIPLCQLHSVVLKALPYSNVLISKMVLSGVGKKNISTAYQIVRNTECTDVQLQLLRRAFPSLIAEQTSVRRLLIAEFLLSECVAEISRNEAIHESGGRIAFDYHQTLAELQAFTDLLLNETEKDEYGLILDGNLLDEVPYLNFENMWLYPHNCVGHLIEIMMIPDCAKTSRTILEIKIMSDLLALEIGRQLGEVPTLDDPYSGAAYGFDELNNRWFSVGPDGAAATDDDVYLE